MRVLLTGAAGKLGQALRQQVPEGVELIATSRNGGGDGLLPLDLADAEACRAAVRSHRPDWVLNGGAPRAFAEALMETGGHLLQVSTDFVFNGQQGTPYRPEQSRDPLGAYGRTKATGEEAVEQQLAGSGRGVILRTSWVMGPVGKNFALTMLRLHRERAASWFDVAVAVGELAQELELLEQSAVVKPLTTADYPTPAQRPSYSLLDCSGSRRALGLPPTPWRQVMRQLLQALP
ncbi:sugar nucleotide-binding protein [Synechococcus sp. GreenBA-s]|nr:sugar nucleotide-binding protein [Synechococcus sp. GreenBA-s]